MKRKDKLAVCHVASTPETDKHCTPKAFFHYIEETFDIEFTIDVAADKSNTLCKKWISKKEDALKQKWSGIAWCNPPYSKASEFVEHCYRNALAVRGSTFMLVAARTDTDWWHSYSSKAWKIVYIKGRLKFRGAKAGAPFPSVILIFKRGFKGEPKNVYLSPTPYERGFQRGKPK